MRSRRLHEDPLLAPILAERAFEGNRVLKARSDVAVRGREQDSRSMAQTHASGPRRHSPAAFGAKLESRSLERHYVTEERRDGLEVLVEVRQEGEALIDEIQAAGGR